MYPVLKIIEKGGCFINCLSEFKANELERGIDKKSVSSYISDIDLFFKYLNKNEINFYLIDEKEKIDLIEIYKKYLLKENYKATTINRKLISLNKFFKFKELAIKITFLNIHDIKILDDVITLNEVDKLLNVCSNKRDRAIIITLQHTGLRVSELLEIKIKDIKKDEIEIKGKRNKYRTVMISNKVKRAWLEYLEVRPKTDIQFLFVGQRGALKRQSINKILIKYQKKCHVKRKKVHPHNFRHSCFKTLSDRGVPIDAIADIAGHENLETTRIYTRRTRKELRKILDF